MARVIASTSGTTAASSGGLYGVGVCTPLIRRIGASRSSKPTSAIRAAISAPTPNGAKSSSTISKRPVLRTDSWIVSKSSGAIVRGSISSTEIPSRSRASRGLQDLVDHLRQRDDRDIRPFPDDGRPAELDLVLLIGHRSFDAQDLAVLEEKNRIVGS